MLLLSRFSRDYSYIKSISAKEITNSHGAKAKTDKWNYKLCS